MNSTTGAQPSLTERQRQVLERLDRRVPIKVIAGELGVSPSRINQHIAALKRFSGANDLSELVAYYRQGKLGPPPPSTKGAWTKSQLPETAQTGPSTSWAEECGLFLNDMDIFPLEVPWSRASEPTVVPGVLDGDHAIVRRLVAMWGIAVAVVCTVLLTIAAATTLSRLLDDVAEVPVDETQSAE